MKTTKFNSPQQMDTVKVVKYLTNSFKHLTDHLGRDNSKGTPLYRLQTDFCFFIDEIERGPVYLAPKVIAECNEFLNTIIKDHPKSKSKK